MTKQLLTIIAAFFLFYVQCMSQEGKNKNSVSDSILDGGNIQDLKTIFKYSDSP